MACVSPIKIPNPNFGLQGVGLNFIKDCSQFLQVPCGHCDGCFKLKQLYIIQRAQMEILAGKDLYFGTLTYNNLMIPRVDIGDKQYMYADFRDVRLMFKRIRKDNLLGTSFSFLVVSEYGGLRHRPHFHFILSVPSVKDMATKYSRAKVWHDIILSQWKRNVAVRVNKSGFVVPDTRCPDWRPLCTYVNRNGRRNFDFHFVEPSLTGNSLDVAFYVTKYIHKSPMNEKLRSFLKLNFSADEYLYYWRLLNPHSAISRGFGSPHHPDVIKHIRSGIRYGIKKGFPYFTFLNYDGNSFPLSPYFVKKLTNYIDALDLYYNVRPEYEKDIIEQNKNFYQILRQLDKNKSVRDLILNRDMYDLYDFDV